MINALLWGNMTSFLCFVMPRIDISVCGRSGVVIVFFIGPVLVCMMIDLKGFIGRILSTVRQVDLVASVFIF